jgi:hypothetical protein
MDPNIAIEISRSFRQIVQIKTGNATMKTDTLMIRTGQTGQMLLDLGLILSCTRSTETSREHRETPTT